MMYRILTKVDKGGPAGGLSRFEWLTEEQVGILVAVGAIAPVQTPPLAVLAGWTRRAGMLAELGIERGDQFLEADPEALAGPLKVKAETVRRWQEDVTRQMTIPLPEGR